MKEVSPTSKSSTEQETFCLLVARFSSSESTHSAEWWWWWERESGSWKVSSQNFALRAMSSDRPLPTPITLQLTSFSASRSFVLVRRADVIRRNELESSAQKRETNRRSSARINVMKWEIFGVRMKLSDNVRLFVANRNLPPPLLAEMKSFPITVFHVWLPLAHREKSRVEVSMRDGKMHRTGNECN